MVLVDGCMLLRTFALPISAAPTSSASMSLLSLLVAKSIKKTTEVLSLRSSLYYFNLSSYSSRPLCRHKKPFSSPAPGEPPIPRKIPYKVTAHGRTWDDAYHWMSNVNDPEFIPYLEQENSYAETFMAATHLRQRELFSEMASRLPANIFTAPERWGDWFYYQYIPEGKEYPVLCRRPQSDGGGWLDFVRSYFRGQKREEKILDWNEIAEKYGYVHVGTCRVSPDHNLIAYTVDTNGSEQFMLHVKDLRDGKIIPSVKTRQVVSLAWTQDSSTLFYTASDNNQRPYKVLSMRLGSSNESVIFTENDASFCVDITCTKDGKYITVNSNSRTSSEVYVIDATRPLDGLRRVHKRVAGVRYFLEHHHGFFYALTNYPLNEVEGLTDGNYYLAKLTVKDASIPNWKSIILPNEGTTFQDMDIFNTYLVLLLERKGCSVMCSFNVPVDIGCKQVMKVKDMRPWYFPVPSDLCRMASGSNHDYMTSKYRAVLSSPVMPDIVVDYDMSRKTFSVIHQEEVVGVSNCKAQSQLLPVVAGDTDFKQQEGLNNWDDLSSTYSCERHDVLSYDGELIPLTIVFPRDSLVKGQSPGLLHVYGAYGEELEKTFCGDRLSLLDRGWVVAFADVRGGGGGDCSWHHQGSGVHKKNSVYDFISCAKYLIDEGYVKRDELAAIGHSAGALVVGAAINFCPGLFRSTILKVPFLDVCNTLMDPNLPLTILDYEEFGNPQMKSEFEAIMSYSPYDNIVSGTCYPAMLVTASFNDSRVGVWEAAKWVAKIRERTCRSCSRSVILKTEMTGGHFGEGGRYGQCEEKAYEYAFLMNTVSEE